MKTLGETSVNSFFDRLIMQDFFDLNKSTEDVYVINQKLGTGFIERITLSEGVELIFTEMVFKEHVEMEFQMLSNFFEFIYSIEGVLSFKEANHDKIITVQPNSTYYWRNGSQKGWARYEKNTKYKSIGITYSENFFSDFLGDSVAEDILFGDDANIGFVSSSELVLGFNQIEYYRSEMKSLHRYIYLYSKAFEIAALFIKEKENNMFHVQSECTLCDDDIEKIHLARNIIESNIEEPYSIEGLSKVVGLNTFKLKTGFKKLYQNTIFGHLRNCRMRKARQCLECSSCTILEVANQVGYSNPSHFSVAFKKMYGVNPSELRRGFIKLSSGT